MFNDIRLQREKQTFVKNKKKGSFLFKPLMSLQWLLWEFLLNLAASALKKTITLETKRKRKEISNPYKALLCGESSNGFSEENNKNTELK